MSETLSLFTIGFTKKSAEDFFTKLQDANVTRILDVRLKNSSHLAGFAKQEHLVYFLRAIASIDYVHLPDLAPTEDMLTHYKKSKTEWDSYETAFLELIRRRKVEMTHSMELFHMGCLLCSEQEPDQCHRRLVAEYLKEQWGNVEITHL
ncbi:MAG: DUF488 family protein [Gemmataceae bacterium]